jgi:hypothetical protein
MLRVALNRHISYRDKPYSLSSIGETNTGEELSMKRLNKTSEILGLHTLLNQAVYGVCLNIKKQFMATQNEFVILRHCSALLESRPDHSIHIVSAERVAQASFVTTTLLHLGVSCAQIKLSYVSADVGVPDGLWLVVAKDE